MNQPPPNIIILHYSYTNSCLAIYQLGLYNFLQIGEYYSIMENFILLLSLLLLWKSHTRIFIGMMFVKNPFIVIGQTRFFYCLIQLPYFYIFTGGSSNRRFNMKIEILLWAWLFLLDKIFWCKNEKENTFYIQSDFHFYC